MTYCFNGSQKLLFFGAYPAIGLSEARLKRDAAKKLFGLVTVWFYSFAACSASAHWSQ